MINYTYHIHKYQTMNLKNTAPVCEQRGKNKVGLLAYDSQTLEIMKDHDRFDAIALPLLAQTVPKPLP